MPRELTQCQCLRIACLCDEGLSAPQQEEDKRSHKNGGTHAERVRGCSVFGLLLLTLRLRLIFISWVCFDSEEWSFLMMRSWADVLLIYWQSVHRLVISLVHPEVYPRNGSLDPFCFLSVAGTHAYSLSFLTWAYGLGVLEKYGSRCPSISLRFHVTFEGG